MRYLSAFATLGLMLVCSTACRSKTEPSPPESSAKPASSVARPPAAAPSTDVVAAAPGLSEAEAKQLVARWEAVQNEKDFASYSQLYAERFMGVKRVGTYSKRFDRARWLVDRKPMVEGGAKVTVSDLELIAAGGSTRAIFTQRFESAGFRDVGRKELLLVASPGGVVISREEMLNSEIGATGPGDASVLGYDRGGAVVQRGFDKATLKSRPKLLSAPKASTIDVGFDVPPEALSEGTRAWLGREVTVYAANGRVCSGRVARFEVRVHAVPHFGMLQSWNGEGGEPKATPEQIATAVDDIAQNAEHFVVAVLDRACDGSWASSVARPLTLARPATGELRELGVAAFKKLPAYVELQRKFTQETSDTTHAWEAVDGALNVVELRVTGRPAVLLVSARGSTACNGFGGGLSAFWELAGTAETPTLEPRPKTFAEYVTLRAAIDDGGTSGLALLLGPDNFNDELAVLRLGAPRPARRVLHSTSFWDCGC